MDKKNKVSDNLVFLRRDLNELGHTCYQEYLCRLVYLFKPERLRGPEFVRIPEYMWYVNETIPVCRCIFMYLNMYFTTP